MQGIVKEKNTPGAEYRTDLAVPEITADQVLVKVHAVAICGTDMHIYDWTEYARTRVTTPMVFGHEFSGEIVKIGERVSNYKIGDRVAGETHIPCMNCEMCRTGYMHICEDMKIIGVQETGAFADYIPVDKNCLWKLKDEFDYKVGAVLEPMGVAVHGVLSGDVGGKVVVILGCGPIGLFAIAAAKGSGAAKVIAMDVFDKKLEVASKVGADVLVNSRTQDLKQIVLDNNNGNLADVVIDYTGNQAAISAGFKALKKRGRFTFVGLANGSVSLDINNDIIYKEAIVNGVTGREMYKTWYDCDRLIEQGCMHVADIIGGEFKYSEFNEAFSAIKAGVPGKILLIPD